jgi:AcrR family transcriptional regulator
VAAIATTLGVSRASIYRHLPALAAEQAAAFRELVSEPSSDPPVARIPGCGLTVTQTS